MGLDINGTRFLLYAKISGIDYSQSVMIGRQLLLLNPSELKISLDEFDFSYDEDIIHSIFNKNDGYAEELFRCLGADAIESFDNSAYEGATQIHDMNHEIPDSLKENYTMVFDGGSLEHVFNFPVALKNCMEMVKIGGHYLGITPINNFMGHGFYQFSPELYYSVFTKDNGFELIDIIAFEDEKSAWYSVKSPISVGDRITLVNCTPTYLLLIARRVSRSPIFESLPQQSDYVAIWNKGKLSKDGTISGTDDERELVATIKKYLPIKLKYFLKQARKRLNSGFSSRFFKQIVPSKGTGVSTKSQMRKLIKSPR